jgi:hypothetical protein
MPPMSGHVRVAGRRSRTLRLRSRRRATTGPGVLSPAIR